MRLRAAALVPRLFEAKPGDHPREGRAAFYRSSDPAERLRLAAELADRIVGARGFFEWESDSEELN